MQFTVSFYSERGCSISLKNSKSGLKLVDWIRKELKIDDLSIEVINDLIEGKKQDKTIQLTEDEARRTGHFEDTTNVEVIVPQGFLNKFLEKKAVIILTSDGKAIEQAFAKYELNEDEVIKEWLNVGAPLKVEK